MSDETRAKKVAYEARVAARAAASVSVVSIADVVHSHPASSPELAGMAEVGASSSSNSGETTNIIILDGGSDSMLFNRYYDYLLHRVESYSCNLTGIGGLVVQNSKGRNKFYGYRNTKYFIFC
jgi:hypothetical protein